MLQRALLALLGVSAALAETVTYTFNIANGDVSPDGFNRAAVLVNNKFPGPGIFANVGDTLVVNTNNRLTDTTMRRSTSIHWHGLLQRRTPYSDGPSFITQCPIAPFVSYPYTMELLNAGTYWYHSHLGSQYVDGLTGPLIIYDPQDPHQRLYDVDDESTIIFLRDWYHRNANEMLHEFMLPNNTAFIEAVPDSGTINGVGRYRGGPETPRSVMQVTPGTRYRYRIINGSGIATFRFSIEGHNFTVIEADGLNTEPRTADYLDILAGQRYSIIVTANQPVANYWIRASMSVRNSNMNPLLDTNNNLAILRYDGAPEAEPTTAPGAASGRQLVESSLAPLENPGSPRGDAPADKVFNFTFTREANADSMHFLVNGIQWKPPTMPTLLKLLSGADDADDFLSSEATHLIHRGDLVEINISGTPGHPMHLHGHHFDVVKGADGIVNYVNPPRRDTTGTAMPDNITIRFLADNPGPWVLHCHIDWHFEAGFAVVFAEDTSGVRENVRPPPEWDQLCPKYISLPPSAQ